MTNDRQRSATELKPSSESSQDSLRLSVVIITYRRPEHLLGAIRSLLLQVRPVDELIVVDASPISGERSTRENWRSHSARLAFVHAPELAGHMTASRNRGLPEAHGDVVAFLDDDVRADPSWAAALIDGFSDPSVLGVAGRVRNGIPGEEVPTEPVGRLRADGSLSAGFAAAFDRPVEIDHGIGANMAFRRDVLVRLNGLRDDYPHPALREETDLFLRVGALPGRVLFLPGAIVDELAAEHVVGARFDTRYKYIGRRNHIVMLGRNFGVGHPITRRYLASELRTAMLKDDLPVVRRMQKLGVTIAGLAAGLTALPGRARWSRLPVHERGGRQLPPRPRA